MNFGLSQILTFGRAATWQAALAGQFEVKTRYDSTFDSIAMNGYVMTNQLESESQSVSPDLKVHSLCFYTEKK